MHPPFPNNCNRTLYKTEIFLLSAVAKSFFQDGLILVVAHSEKLVDLVYHILMAMTISCSILIPAGPLSIRLL